MTGDVVTGGDVTGDVEFGDVDDEVEAVVLDDDVAVPVFAGCVPPGALIAGDEAWLGRLAAV